MTSPKFTLSWDSFQNNICSGLSSLQQNGELVDMTLAADGHHVKVHQLVMSLVSPYIKDLIASAQCPHPIIFLNQISYKTLCSILEYIYTGEAVVAREDMQEVFTAANALRLRGFDDKGSIHTMLASASQTLSQYAEKPKKESSSKNITEVEQACTSSQEVEDTDMRDNSFEDESPVQEDDSETTQPCKSIIRKKKNISNKNSAPLQYTLSNQGMLQLILNRFIYYPKYTIKSSGDRRWQCVEYIKHRCPAAVVTNEKVVVKRLSTHTHPFHDRRILNKVKAGIVFTDIQCAEDRGKDLRNSKTKTLKNITLTKPDGDTQQTSSTE